MQQLSLRTTRHVCFVADSTVGVQLHPNALRKINQVIGDGGSRGKSDFISDSRPSAFKKGIALRWKIPFLNYLTF